MRSVANGVRPRNRRVPGLLRGIGDHLEVPARRESSLVGVENIGPGEGLPIKGGDPHPDAGVQAGVRALPDVEPFQVVTVEVVQKDVRVSTRSLDDGRQGSIPTDVFTAERETPAIDPSSAGHGRVRGPLLHLRRVEVAGVSRVQGHCDLSEGYGA